MKFESFLRFDTKYLFLYNTLFSAKERTENQTACYVMKIDDIKRPALNGGRKYTVQFGISC